MDSPQCLLYLFFLECVCVCFNTKILLPKETVLGHPAMPESKGATNNRGWITHRWKCEGAPTGQRCENVSIRRITIAMDWIHLNWSEPHEVAKTLKTGNEKERYYHILCLPRG